MVAVANDAEEADAALKIVVSRTGTSALLVNARGTILWRGTRRYSGQTSKVASDIVKDLVSAIKQ